MHLNGVCVCGGRSLTVSQSVICCPQRPQPATPLPGRQHACIMVTIEVQAVRSRSLRQFKAVQQPKLEWKSTQSSHAASINECLLMFPTSLQSAPNEVARRLAAALVAAQSDRVLQALDELTEGNDGPAFRWFSSQADP